MLDKTINMYTLLISGIVLIILGVLSLFTGNIAFKYIILTFFIIVFIYSLIQTIILIKNRKRNKLFFNKLLTNIITIFFSLLIISQINFIMMGITFFFGVYVLLHSILHFVNFYIILTNNMPNKIKNLFMFIVTFIFGVLLILNPTDNMYYAYIVIGLYLIFLGISLILDFKSTTKPRKFKIMPPMIITAFLPKLLISKINSLINSNDTSNFYYDKGVTPDIEVIFHLAPNGTAVLGHVEVAYKNNIYSYGNYNPHSRKFFDLIGDGIIVIANKNKYIKYAVTKKDRYLVKFGIKLNEKQKNAVEKRIKHITENNTVDHYTDYQLYKMGKLPKSDYNDMSSDYSRYCDATFKKITKGKLKKFFVVKTNCVRVADYILQGAGTKVININGILTPGTYYSYLNNEFIKNNSNVISRKVYTKNDYKK